jgi:hypothetical protein
MTDKSSLSSSQKKSEMERSDPKYAESSASTPRNPALDHGTRTKLISPNSHVEKNQTPFEPVRDQQHEIIYNKFLPYAENINAEAALWLDDIKLNLSKCVLAADYRPGVFFWTTRLDSYISLYGRLFSKEDHMVSLLILQRPHHLID